jgi:D-alanine-D-alanine ligase-like ATP-grasp enzyme/acylphosphatase
MNDEFIRALIAEGANDFSRSPYLKVRRNIALDLIGDEARKQDISICFYERMCFRLTGHGRAVVFHQNAPENSVVATSITPSKNLTKKILAQRGLPVPQGKLFDDYAAALDYFTSRGKPQVVKPNAGARSRGVTSNITTTAAFEAAWAFASNDGESIVVEDFITGDYLRVLVIGGKARGAFVCVPAHVTGDGQSTIAALIERKNAARRRQPATRPYPIKRTDLLEAAGYTIDSVPAAGVTVALTAVANVGAGGETIEVVSRVEPSLLALAEQAVAAIPGMHFGGVDLIVGDFRKPAQPDNAVILEINSNPAFDDHVFPMYGASVDIPGILVDFAMHGDGIGQKTGERHAAYVALRSYRASCGGDSFARSYAVQMQVIQQAAHRRNLAVQELSPVTFVISGARHGTTFRQSMSDRTTAVSRMASNLKDWTKQLLREAGVNTPSGESFEPDQLESGWRFAESLGQPVVVKPVAGSGGNGVSVNVSTREHFELAWKLAREVKSRRIIVEEFFAANDYRLLAVGDALCAAMQRIPAHVIGDGSHTVQELIDIKNREREANPHLGAKAAKLTPMIEFNLERLGLGAASVPDKGQYLQLHAVANIGSGGDSRDVSDIMHPDFADIAVRARRAVFDPAHAGIDLLAEDITKSPRDQRWMVIEVNTNPDLALHHFPSQGTPRDAAGALIEHLFPEARVMAPGEEKSVNVMIRGKVHDAGFRKWIWRQAHLHALSGWSRNNADGTVEAVLRGAPHAVDHLADMCKTGPARARVEAVIVQPYDKPVADGFIIRPLPRAQ